MGNKKKKEEPIQQNNTTQTDGNQQSANATQQRRDDFVPLQSVNAPQMPTGATIQNPNNSLATPDTTPKPKTIADYIEDHRESLVKEQTDAQKMQQYYALTDALNSLGNMGATAVGGAIGGNMLDSAPNVGEYKPNKGYLDAFERAKQAKEKIRAMDDRYYQLALRDDERSYQQQVNAENRRWQKELADYNHKIKRAEQKEDWAEKERLQKELLKLENEYKANIAELTHQYNMELQDSKNQGALEEAKVRQETAIINSNPTDKNERRMLKDGSTIAIPKGYYQAMTQYFINKSNGAVDNDNVEEYIYNNPDAVREFLSSNRLIQSSTASPTTTQQPQPKVSMADSQWPYYQYADNETYGGSGKIDLSQWERK